MKTTLDQQGSFPGVRLIPSHKHYYSNMCSYCKNYLYLTSLECSSCHKNFCPRHLSQCQCPHKQCVLVLRELNKDRMALRELLPELEVSIPSK